MLVINVRPQWANPIWAKNMILILIHCIIPYFSPIEAQTHTSKTSKPRSVFS